MRATAYQRIGIIMSQKSTEDPPEYIVSDLTKCIILVFTLQTWSPTYHCSRVYTYPSEKVISNLYIVFSLYLSLARSLASVSNHAGAV